eukprot:gene2152-8657_t
MGGGGPAGARGHVLPAASKGPLRRGPSVYVGPCALRAWNHDCR